MGYDPDDQYYYSPGLLAELVPMAVAGPEPPATGLHEGGGGPGDPAEGGNLLTMIVDVRRGMGMISGEAAAALRRAVQVGDGVPPSWALAELLDALGGPRTKP